MDISTIVGSVFGTVCILVSIMLTSDWGLDPNNLIRFIDIPSVFIVIGGTLATMLMRYSFGELFTIMGIVKNAFVIRTMDPTAVIKEFVQLAQIARKDGLLALERVTIEDPFMSKGINYCVDGSETDQIKSVLGQEISSMKARHTSGQDMLKAMELTAPAFGMIGTLIGLVNMLANMDDPKSIGPAMAVAILTTLYGAVIANLFAIPLKDKLSMRSSAEADVKTLMIEGILAINRGENPRMLEESLYSFLSPKQREQMRTGT